MQILLRMGSAALAAALVGGVTGASGAKHDEKSATATDEVFADLAKPGSPGCALAAARDGKILYEHGYGLANIEENVPIAPTTIFDIGSTSKQFTAASILLLEKQGKLSVRDDIRKYLPELPDYGRKITILHLLNHTSGLRDYLTLMDLAGINTDSVTTDEDALEIVTRQKALNFDPGAEFLYSNTGFFLLSVIVKRVSSKTLREFAGENIFEPLGMAHTQYRDDHTALIPNRAMAYDWNEKKHAFTLDVSYFEQTGDGAVHTSVEDLLKWDENFYSGQVGGQAFLAEIQEPGKLNSGKTLDYAKGLMVGNYRGLRTVMHGGAWGGYRAQLLRFPDQHFSVVCLCNLGSAQPDARAHRVADVYLSGEMKAKTSKDKTEDDEDGPKASPTANAGRALQDYAGDYWSDELAVSYRLAVADGALRLVKVLDASGWPRPFGLPDNAFKASGSDQFSGAFGLKLKFAEDAAHHITGFTLDAGRTKGMIFLRRDTATK
ncbi:MAG TPA: serine hydrolase domain-containing protein [Candidatus Acidoferrales bacterium]|nr:serine hydrolase domain-containing protein [Candidatus Acidoferrales bacterium]